MLIGKCSFCGAIWCREAKSSIVLIATGEPTGEPETLRCCMMSENAATGIGSSTAPTTCSRPFGTSVPIIASQSSFTLTVLIRRSKLAPSFLIAAESLLETTWFAPKPLASSNLLSLDVNAVTSQPYAAANFTAMCPSPPMPMMPTRSVGLAYMASGTKTVMPPHRSGPASAKFSFSGSGMAQAQCARRWLSGKRGARGTWSKGFDRAEGDDLASRRVVWMLLMAITPAIRRCALLGLLAGAAVSSANEAQAAWITFQADASHTGYVPGRYHFRHASLRWQTTVATIPPNGLAVGDSTIFVTNQARFSNDPSFHALDQATGSVLWSKSFGTNNDTTSPPAYADGVVYFQTDGHSAGIGNFLNAYDARTGATIFNAPYDAQWETYLNPTLFGGNIYLYHLLPQGRQRPVCDLARKGQWTTRSSPSSITADSLRAPSHCSRHARATCHGRFSGSRSPFRSAHCRASLRVSRPTARAAGGAGGPGAARRALPAPLLADHGLDARADG